MEDVLYIWKNAKDLESVEVNCLPGCLTKVLFLMSHLFVSISTGFSNACIVKCDITI